jgi:hypothetical protein
MITSTIQNTYQHNGQARPVPAEVLDRVRDADRVLKEELKDLDDLPITALWSCEMPQHGVWEIVLQLDAEGVPYTHRFAHQFNLMDLVLPNELRMNVRWAVIGFARAQSEVVRKQLRHIQRELQQFVAEGKE